MRLHRRMSVQAVGDARRALPVCMVGAWVTLIAVALAVWALPASAAPAPFDQAVIDAAMAEPEEQYAPNQACPGPAYSTLKQIGTSYCVLRPAQAFYFLALTAYLDPGAQSTGGELVSERVVELFTTLTNDSNTPQVARPLDGWSDGPTAQAILLMKNTRVVWGALDATGRAKADWLMAAMAVLGNWGFNDANNWNTGIGLGGNFSKFNNPNFTQGYLGVMISCVLYFGQAGCDNLFTSFDYDAYIATFQAFNWQNILALTSWRSKIVARTSAGSTPYTMKQLMEHGGDLTHASTNLGSGVGVKVPFSYLGVQLTGPNADAHAILTLFRYESIGRNPPSLPPDPNQLIPDTQPKPMYYWGVASNKPAPDGTAQIIDASQSPVQGQLGMAYEFNASDSSGIRSDALYSFEGWLNNVITRATLQALGVWDPVLMSDVNSRMMVGGADLIYKLEHGYHGRALNANGPNTHYRNVCVLEAVGPQFTCDPTDASMIEGTPVQKGYIYDREIWDNLGNIKPPI